VLGSGYLSKPKSIKLGSLGAFCVMGFTFRQVPKSRMYGVKVQGVSGATWTHSTSNVIVNVSLQP
jgi:hypothetical protein